MYITWTTVMLLFDKLDGLGEKVSLIVRAWMTLVMFTRRLQ